LRGTAAERGYSQSGLSSVAGAGLRLGAGFAPTPAAHGTRSSCAADGRKR
jgi:hypothetical protein